MKPCFLITLIACTVFFGCHKSSNPAAGIIGQWELRKEVGGFAGTIQYPHGQSTVWIFDARGNFQIIYVTGPFAIGEYSIKESAAHGDFLLSFHYSSNGQPFTTTDSVRFSNNQLVVLPGESCCDFATGYWQRLQ